MLYVVDLSDPERADFASVVIQPDPSAWWGNLKVVGDTLYTTHYEWVSSTTTTATAASRYYIDGIDLSDRSAPARSVHGSTCPACSSAATRTTRALLYTVDYRWDGTMPNNDFDVAPAPATSRRCSRRSRVSGWTGSTFIQGTTAYVSAQRYPDPNNPNDVPVVELHAIDVSNPQHPVDHVASGGSAGVGCSTVAGDRLLVTSGWGPDGLDIYTLSPGQAPQFSQTVRTSGWSDERRLAPGLAAVPVEWLLGCADRRAAVVRLLAGSLRLACR